VTRGDAAAPGRSRDLHGACPEQRCQSTDDFAGKLMIKGYDSKSIDLHKIKSISRGDEGLWKTLSFGFLRACSEEQLSKLLITHIYEKPAFSWIFRCYLEHQDSKSSDEMARHFLSELRQQSDYHKRKQWDVVWITYLQNAAPSLRKLSSWFSYLRGNDISVSMHTRNI
jgi:hypothetical protein